MEVEHKSRPVVEKASDKPPAKPAKTKSAKKVKDPEAEKRRAQRLGHLSRAPGKCPLGACDQMVFPSGLLVHLLHKHSRDPNCTVATIYDNQPMRLSLDPRSFRGGVPQCLAILLYAGVDGKRRTEPGRRQMSFPNAGLLNDRRRYENHLTMALMICKTTFYALLADKELENDLAALNPTTSGLYVIWVVAPITTRRIFYTLTAFDRYYMQSRSVIRKVRNYTHSQNPSDFLPGESDYLLLREAEAMTMLDGRQFLNGRHCFDPRLNNMGALTPGIQLELIIHDHPSTSVMQERTSRQLFETYNIPNARMPRNKFNLFRGVNGKLTLGRKPLSADKDRAREAGLKSGKHEEQRIGKRHPKRPKDGGVDRSEKSGAITKIRLHKKHTERSKGGLEEVMKKAHADIYLAESHLTFNINDMRVGGIEGGIEGGSAFSKDSSPPVSSPAGHIASELLSCSMDDSLTSGHDYCIASFDGYKTSSKPDSNDSYKTYAQEGYQLNFPEDFFRNSGSQVSGETLGKIPSGYKDSSEESLPEKYSGRCQNRQVRNRACSLLSSLLDSSTSSKIYSPFPAHFASEPKIVEVPAPPPSLLISHNEETKENIQPSKKSESSEESLPEKYTRCYQKNLKKRSFPQECKEDIKGPTPSNPKLAKSSDDDVTKERRRNRASRQLDDLFILKEREWESASLQGAGFLIEPIRNPQTLSPEAIPSQNATATESAIKPVPCPMEKVREAVMRTVKDALLLAAKETILMDVDLPVISNSEPDLNRDNEEADAEVEFNQETEEPLAKPEEEIPTTSGNNLTIPTGLALTLEETSGSDWDQP